MKIIVIGGGAAGFFGSIACAETNPLHEVILLEKAKQVLAKVRISGGGRCNVTHACFDPAQLIQYYPRGGKALRGAFSRFAPQNTIQWFEERGVRLKTEEDGRMFPTTDSSETIAHCLISSAKKSGVILKTECGVKEIQKKENGFILHLSDQQTVECDRLLIATGSSPKTYAWLEKLGHTIVAPVPSLFTFNVPSSPLLDLAGISVPQVLLSIEGTSLKQTGPILLTHWGFSGPAVLKLSAWGARILHDMNYRAILKVNWLPDHTLENLKQLINEWKSQHPQRLLVTDTPVPLPKNLWKSLLGQANIPSDLRWNQLSKLNAEKLVQLLKSSTFQIEGKSTYKEEFVTCGGVNLDEVNFKTMESKIVPGLYLAGEVLDIDGVTGGFNFQSAWTTSWLAGKAMAEQLS